MTPNLPSFLSVSAGSTGIPGAIERDLQRTQENAPSFELPGLPDPVGTKEGDAGHNNPDRESAHELPVAVANTQLANPAKIPALLTSATKDDLLARPVDRSLPEPLKLQQSPAPKDAVPVVAANLPIKTETEPRALEVTQKRQPSRNPDEPPAKPSLRLAEPPPQVMPEENGQIDRSFETSAPEQKPTPLFVAPSAVETLRRHLDMTQNPAPKVRSFGPPNGKRQGVDSGIVQLPKVSPISNLKGEIENILKSGPTPMYEDLAAPKLAHNAASLQASVSNGSSAATLPISSAPGPTDVSSNIGQIAVKSTDQVAIIAERTLDMARGDLWLNDLAKDIVSARHAEREISFRMQPENLGRLDVDIATLDEGMRLSLKTGSDEATQLIVGSQTKLTDELRSQGVRVLETEVQTRSDSQAQQDARQAPTTRNDRPDDGVAVKSEDMNREEKPAEKQERFA